ncbi:MAG: HNH endonuclease signature motif containing protein, partial [Actinomycetota bacterium]
LVVRDGGCAVAGCDRPPAWCQAHHLRHWLHGGPTNLTNLALLCRAHHRTVHEGGWRLIRGPDGRFTTSRSPRRPRAA